MSIYSSTLGRMGYLYALVTLLCCSVLSQTLTSHQIEGHVEDGFHSAIAGADVQLYLNAFVPLAQTRTDSDGRFAFRDLPDRKFILSIRKPGFDELRLAIKPDGASKGLQFTLQVAAISENITVTSSRGEAQDVFDTGEATSNVSSLELKQRGALVLPFALREETGVHIQQTTPSQGSPFIRGLTGQHVLHLINGVRFNNSTFRPGANQYSALIDPFLIEQVEIVRGPGSTQYGSDSLGGTINSFTHWGRRGTGKFELNGGFDLLAGSADRSLSGGGRLSAGTRRWGLAGELTGRSVRDLRTGKGIDSHSVVTRLFGLSSAILGERLNDTGYTQYGGNAKFIFQPTERDSFSFEYLRGTQLGVKRYDQLDGGLGNLISDFDPQVLDFFTARYDRAGIGFLESLSAIFSFNGQRDDRTSQSINNTTTGLRSKITDEYNRTNAFGYQVQAGANVAKRHSLSFGLEFYDEFVTSKRTDAAFSAATGGFTNISNVRARFPNGSSYRTLGVYVQDLATLIPNKLRGAIGIRYSLFQFSQASADNPLAANGQPTVPEFSTNFADATYNAGLIYSVNKYLNFAGTVRRGFRAPNVNDFGSIGLSGIGFEVSPDEAVRVNARIGNFDPATAPVDPKPAQQLIAEHVISYELNARVRTSRFNFSVNLFSSDISNFIERRTVILQPGSIGQTIGGQVITNQDATGAVYTALSNSPVFVRANAARLRMSGWEAQLGAKLSDTVTLNANMFSIRGVDRDRNLPPALENGVPPATGFVGIKWSPTNRFWIEAYSNFADAQRRFSDNDFQQARIGGMRTRAEIANFFNNGAVARGLVVNGILLATGETLSQVQSRVLGTLNRAPLYTRNPGFVTLNVRGSFTFNERSAIGWSVENILDKNYRTMGSGVDGAGFNAMLRYSHSF